MCWDTAWFLYDRSSAIALMRALVMTSVVLRRVRNCLYSVYYYYYYSSFGFSFVSVFANFSVPVSCIFQFQFPFPLCTHVSLKSMVCLMLSMHVVLFVHCKLLLHSHCWCYRITLHKTCMMVWNGNTMETKTDIAKFISFRVKFFRFHFVSIFPLTDISVSVNVNHPVIHLHIQFIEQHGSTSATAGHFLLESH